MNHLYLKKTVFREPRVLKEDSLSFTPHWTTLALNQQSFLVTGN